MAGAQGMLKGRVQRKQREEGLSEQTITFPCFRPSLAVAESQRKKLERSGRAGKQDRLREESLGQGEPAPLLWTLTSHLCPGSQLPTRLGYCGSRHVFVCVCVLEPG